jgi:hypothetical protein
VGGGVQLGPLDTAATNRPTVPAPVDYDGEIGGMMIGRGNRSTRRKPVPVPLCPPQTPHAARTRTRVAAIGSQQLTAWVTARPICIYTLCPEKLCWDFRWLCLQIHETYQTECRTFTVIQSKSFTSAQEQDGEPSRFSRYFMELLGAKFSGRSVYSVVQFCGQLAALIWTPLRPFFWGYAMNAVYMNTIRDLNSREMRTREQERPLSR